MSERYTKLFSQPENLYAEGAPVIVSAGNLLKDNQTGKVLTQLKIRNIAAKPLKAATVLIRPQDAAGKPMEGDTQQKYLDLTAKTGEEFGQKTAVFLPDASTRGFSVEVTQAVFSDNSTWEGTDTAWEPLPAPESLSARLGDAELLKQYQLHFGGKCDVAPQEHKDLWLCACGAWNRGEKCCVCGKDKAALFSLGIDALKADCDARVAKEKAEREAQEAAAEAKANKTKKILAIAIPALAVALALFLLLTTVVIPNSKYNKAVALLDAGQYEEAIIAFEALNGYKDSAEQITVAKAAKAEAEKSVAYEKAEALLAAGDYDGAIAAFQRLGNYRDSQSRIKEVENAKQTEMLYSEALGLLTSSNPTDQQKAYLLLTELGDYKDSASYLPSFIYAVITEDNKILNRSYSYSYDSSGRVIGIKSPYDDYVFEYNRDGELISKTYQHYESNMTTIYTYGEDGMESEFWQTTKTATFTGSYKYEFQNGILLSGVFTEKDSNGNIVFVSTLYYDEHGNPTKREETRGNIKTILTFENEYDSDGRLIAVRNIRDGKFISETRYTYDISGNLVSEEITWATGSSAKKTYIYGYIYAPDA